MKQFVMLLKKEWWEWRSVVLVLLASLIVIFALLTTSYWINVKNGEEAVKAGNHHLFEGGKEKIRVLFITPLNVWGPRINPPTFENYEKFLQQQQTEFVRDYVRVLRLFMTQSVWIIGLAVSFMLASSFYKEKRDGSIFYMKGLPVHDYSVIAAKLACGLFFFFLLGIVAGLFFLVISKAGLSMAVSSFAGVVRPSLSFTVHLSLFWKWAQFLLFYTFIIVPVSLLILLVSALSRQIHPFILAHCINGMIIVIPLFFKRFLGIDFEMSGNIVYEMSEGGLKISLMIEDAGSFLLAYGLPIFWANQGENLNLMDTGYFSQIISLPMFFYISTSLVLFWCLIKAYRRTVRSV